MSAPDVPSWIDVTKGTAPILLFAPHGGRRHDPRIPGTHKVNDLWTADVTRQLAAACGASTIVNPATDRNVVDLNRLSQVRRDAPWLLDLLARSLDDMLARFGRATVLVVHGWNVSQAACDVGIGLRDESGRLVACRPGAQTVSDAFVTERLRPLQARAQSDGITVTIGSRYPAAHPNNLLQLFRTVPEGLDDGLLARLRERGRIEAAQVELAIPLRWPGPRRDRLVALLVETLAREAPPTVVSATVARAPRALAGRVTRRRGLQFVADEMLVMASIDATDVGPTGGRLVISRDVDRLALFTGELSSPEEPWRVPPLSIEADATGRLRLTFEGPIMTFPSHTPFLDLERGLAGGTVTEGWFDVTFRPARDGLGGDASNAFGDVQGKMMVDGISMPVATRGVGTTAVAPGARRFPSCRVTLPTSSWGTVALATDPDEPLYGDGGEWRGVLTGHATIFAADRRTRADAALRLGDGEGALTLYGSDGSVLAGRLERLIPVRRPGREGTVVETTFALVRVAGTCVGWLEVTTVSAS